MLAIVVLAGVLFGVLVLFAALCVLLAMATAKITNADDPEGRL